MTAPLSSDQSLPPPVSKGEKPIQQQLSPTDKGIAAVRPKLTTPPQPTKQNLSVTQPDVNAKALTIEDQIKEVSKLIKNQFPKLSKTLMELPNPPKKSSPTLLQAADNYVLNRPENLKFRFLNEMNTLPDEELNKLALHPSFLEGEKANLSLELINLIKDPLIKDKAYENLLSKLLYKGDTQNLESRVADSLRILDRQKAGHQASNQIFLGKYTATLSERGSDIAGFNKSYSKITDKEVRNITFATTLMHQFKTVEFIKFVKNLPDSPQKGLLVEKMFARLHENDRIDEAISIVKELVNPQHKIVALLAETLFNNGLYDKAISLLDQKKVTSAEDKKNRSILIRSFTNNLLKLPKAKSTTSAKFAALNPLPEERDIIYLQIITSYILKGKLDKGAALLKNIFIQSQKDTAASTLADAYLMNGNIAKFKEFVGLIQDKPLHDKLQEWLSAMNIDSTYIKIAESLMGKKQFSKALEFADKINNWEIKRDLKAIINMMKSSPKL